MIDATMIVTNIESRKLTGNDNHYVQQVKLEFTISGLKKESFSVDGYIIKNGDNIKYTGELGRSGLGNIINDDLTFPKEYPILIESLNPIKIHSNRGGK